MALALGANGALLIFLHATHFLFAILTIVALHITGAMWDLQESKHYAETGEKLSAEVKKLYEEQGELLPKRYWSGALWAVVVGLLGLVALGVLVASVVIKLPKFFKFYYLVAAILILFFASLGLGLNLEADAFSSCSKKLDYKAKEWCVHAASPSGSGGSGTQSLGRDGGTGRSAFGGGGGCSYFEKAPAPAPAEPGKPSCADNYKAAHPCDNYNCLLLTRFIVYAISFVHMILYGAAFAVAFSDGSTSPSTSISPYDPASDAGPSTGPGVTPQSGQFSENPSVTGPPPPGVGFGGGGGAPSARPSTMGAKV